MKKMILISFISLFVLASGQTQTIRTADNALEKLISENEVVGASAGYAKNGDIVWQSAVGFANEKEKLALKPDTKMRTASIAKSMTAVAIMQLVENGKLDIDKPVEIYFPEFKQIHKTKITVKYLLSHTSGIGAYKNRKEAENTTYFENLLEAYKVFEDRKVLFEPGTQYSYTTYGYVVLGIIIENVSGMSYEDYMQKHIWDKAGMTHTGIEKRSSLPENYSELYHKLKKGKFRLADGNDLSNRIPGGGLYSTSEDLLKFGMALLDETLIKKSSLDEMTKHHSLEKYNNGYGLGFYLYGKPDVNDIYGHNGAQTGASCQLFIIPSLNLVTVAMSNTSGAGRELSNLAGKLIEISQNE